MFGRYTKNQHINDLKSENKSLTSRLNIAHLRSQKAEKELQRAETELEIAVTVINTIVRVVNTGLGALPGHDPSEE